MWHHSTVTSEKVIFMREIKWSILTLRRTTHDTHNRQISMPPVGFEPKISAGERPEAARLLTMNS